MVARPGARGDHDRRVFVARDLFLLLPVVFEDALDSRRVPRSQRRWRAASGAFGYLGAFIFVPRFYTARPRSRTRSRELAFHAALFLGFGWFPLALLARMAICPPVELGTAGSTDIQRPRALLAPRFASEPPGPGSGWPSFASVLCVEGLCTMWAAVARAPILSGRHDDGAFSRSARRPLCSMIRAGTDPAVWDEDGGLTASFA
jgi:hypothetical protein